MELTLAEKMKAFEDKELERKQVDEEIHRLEQTLIQPLKDKRKIVTKELESLGQLSTINISVRDLIREISELTGISPEEIFVELDYFGIWSTKDYQKEDFVKNAKKPQLKLMLSNKRLHGGTIQNELKEGDFYYFLTFLSDFYEPQADGKSLIEHSYTIRDHADGLPWLRMQTSLYIKEEDVMNIICHFKLWDIATSTELSTRYPKKLLSQALQNYEKRQKEKSLEKIRKMVI